MVHRRIVMLLAIVTAMLAVAPGAASAADPGQLWEAYPLAHAPQGAGATPSVRMPRQTPPAARPPSRNWTRQHPGPAHAALPGIVSLASAAIVLAVALSWVVAQIRTRRRPRTAAVPAGVPAAGVDGADLVPWSAVLATAARAPSHPPAREGWAGDVYDDAFAQETDRIQTRRRAIAAGVANTEERR